MAVLGAAVTVLSLAMGAWGPALGSPQRIDVGDATGGGDGSPLVASLALSQLASPPLTVSADASGSTDTDATPIASYQFDFGDSTPVVMTIAPTAVAQHTYAAPGTYTVTLTVTDTGNHPSTPASATITVTPPDFPPTASLVLSQLASPVLTVSADASGSTDTDATPIASYQFDFGDSTPVVMTTAPTAVAQHTYAAPGTPTVTLTVTDTGNQPSTPVSATITVNRFTPVTMERRTVTSADDAEESADGTMNLTSSDLELIEDSSDQTVGMRWTGLAIPVGSTVTAAYIQFSAKESQSGVTTLVLQGQAADNPPTFGSTSGNISTRPRTTAATSWAPVPWTAGEAGVNQRTPDLSAVFQEVVSRAGWASGNALVMIVTGAGHRTAWAYDGNAAAAPLLHVEFLTLEGPPTASLVLSQLVSPALTVSANASGSTDTDLTPIASYHFDFGDGTPVVTTIAPTAIAQHTYAAAGTHTVTLTVTDTGNNTSAPVSATITVTSGQVAVYAGYYDTHHATNPKPKPNPWKGSPGVVFVGQPDGQPGDPPGGGWDTSTLRLVNLTTGSLNGVVVTVDIGTDHYARWGTKNIAAGSQLILAQTAFENFDGSDTSPAGCYGCDTTLCVTLRSTTVPMVHVTIGGTTTHYLDTGQILNTHGADAAGCPYVGGPLPQTRYDESEAWLRIYPTASAPSVASPLGPEGPASPRAAILPPPTLWLAPPAPNPTRGEFGVRFTTLRRGPVRVSLYDLTGRVVHRFVDNVLDAGSYSFEVDLADVSPGIYVLSLWTPQDARHEKLILMR